MTIDIMLPYYGDVEMMKLAVKSVTSQSEPDWRLTVIDDGYPDPGPARFFEQLCAAEPRIRYFRNDTNLGANGNYRKALDMVETEYFVMMGADDIMLSNYLDTIFKDLKQFPEADVVQPGVNVIDEHGSPVNPLPDRIKKFYAPKTSSPISLSGEAMASSLIRADWAYFPSLTWKTETTRRIGFAEGLDVVQDLALLIDVAAENGTMVVDPTLAFLYRRHMGSDSSVRALDGRRFDEERAFFQSQAQRFKQLGWNRAAKAATFHITSRLNAASLMLRSIGKGKFDSLGRLGKHVVG